MHVRLRYARIDAGYESASAAAKAHGWPISTLTAHENGQNDYNAQQAEVYAKAFKTTAEWLMFGKTPSPPPGSRDQVLTRSFSNFPRNSQTH